MTGMSIKSRFLPTIIVALVVAACSGSSPTATPSPAPTSPPAVEQVVLPFDDAPHSGFNTEWWYYSGHLETAGGDRYGFHYVVFRFDLPFLALTHMSHLAITDHQRDAYVTDQRLAPGEEAIPGAGSFDLAVDGWTMSGAEGRDRLAADAQGYELDLSLASTVPVTLHGGQGLIPYGPAGETFYYSRTRMDVEGTIAVDGAHTAVNGQAWFDRQWGDFEIVALGWDWFSLQLDDGSALMLYELRDAAANPGRPAGTFVAPDGTFITLEPADFETTATGSWTSPANGARYPMGWRIAVPGRGVDVTLTPVIEHAEFDATSTTRNYYWEGPVEVTGSHLGVGFVELVGYAPFTLPTS